MKGNNSLLFNSATLVEAMQEYLDRRITPSVEVLAIKVSPKNCGMDSVFEVEITDDTRTKEKPDAS